MLLIGLTGGIASGKTLVSDFFTALGVPVIDADILAREVVAPGSEGLKKLTDYFSDSILTSNNQLDRKALREIIFQDPSDREIVDGILHPLIRQRSEEGIARYRDQGAVYIIYAVPLLVETKQVSRFDRVLLVDVPVELQIERIVSRDNSTRDQAQAIISAQASREERRAIATDIISNDKSVDSVREHVMQLHKQYTDLAQASLSD